MDGRALYETRSLGRSPGVPAWIQLDAVAGILVKKTDVGTSYNVIDRRRVEALLEWFAPANESDEG